MKHPIDQFLRLSAMLLSVLTGAQALAAPLASFDFESGQGAAVARSAAAPVNSRDRGLTPPEVPARDAASIDCSVARSGKCSLRTKVGTGPDYVSFGHQRVEWSLASQRDVKYGQDEQFTYKFSLRLPEDWKDDSRDSADIVWQFKHEGTPPDAFVAVKGRDIVLRGQRAQQLTLVKNVAKGQWFDFRFEVLWSTGADGLLRAQVREGGSGPYRDAGQLTGPNLTNAKPKSGYIKFGIYKPASEQSVAPDNRVIFHDDISISKGFEQ